MLEYSYKRIRPSGILLGMVVGIAIGLLLTGSSISRSGRPSNAVTVSRADFARFSFAEIARLPNSTLSCLCEEAASTARSAAPTGETNKELSLSGGSAILAGILNARRLLPIAKTLSINAILDWGEQNGLNSRDLLPERRKIEAVHKVILDGGLGDTAAVGNDHPREIRIGSGYAETLISDDEVIFLLGHELTHIAAQTGGLDGFIENISGRAKVTADVEVLGDQGEDLACDFIGAQVLKHFIDLYPTNQSKSERLLRTCGYELPAERLARAWQDFCASYNGFVGDTRHLSQGLTVRALAGLDPEFKEFIDRFSIKPEQ